MYTKITQQGGMNREKTFTYTASIPDTSNIDWDDSRNGMNDEYNTVTTDATTWVWLYEDTNYGQSGDNILVPANKTNYVLADHDFTKKVGSFKVYDHDPTEVPPTPPPSTEYKTFETLTPPPVANKRYLLFVKNEQTNNNFQPLSFINGVLGLDPSVYNNNALPTTGTIGTDLSMQYQWQFFKVSSGNYVIANCDNGELLAKSENMLDNESVEIELETNTDVSCIYSMTKYQDESDNLSDTIAMRDVTGAGDTFLSTYLDANGANALMEGQGDPYNSSQWYLLEYSEFEMPEITTIGNLGLPTFDNGIAPPLFPIEPQISNSVYVPYFMVNDKTMKNWGDRIQNSPYYLLVQKSQYKISASVMNNTDSVDIFNESWTYGWSVSLSASVSADLGFSIGETLEANLFVVKDSLEASINAELGISLTGGIIGSGSYSKDVSVKIPGRSCVAFYGIETTYELYQMNGISCISNPNVPMRMDNNFLTITGTIPN